MKKLKRTVCFIISFVLFVSVLSVPVFAEDKYTTVSVSSATGVPLDTVLINVNMETNPGLMAMTFTVNYDKNALAFQNYNLGIFTDYTIVDHPESGYVSFVNCESYNKTYEGLIFSIEFQIKEKATPGLHPITIKNIRPEQYGDSMSGCFADWSRSTIYAQVKNGGITVGESCLNTDHIYGNWTTVTEPTCEGTGVEIRSCINCGHSESRDIPAKGHDFESFWTIDQKASFGISGIMSRHCKNCSAVTDKTTFSASDANQNNFDNNISTTVKEQDFDKLKKTTDSEIKAEQPNKTIDKNNEPESKQPTTNSKITEKTADDIISTIKKADSLPLRIYRYLFGNDGKSGVISKITSVFSRYNEENRWNIMSVTSLLGILFIII